MIDMENNRQTSRTRDPLELLDAFSTATVSFLMMLIGI
jgi:hypothetical protein